MQDAVETKVIVAGLSTTCSQKIHNQLVCIMILLFTVGNLEKLFFGPFFFILMRQTNPYLFLNGGYRLTGIFITILCFSMMEQFVLAEFNVVLFLSMHEL